MNQIKMKKIKAEDMLSVEEIKAAVKVLNKNRAPTVWGFSWHFPFIYRYYILPLDKEFLAIMYKATREVAQNQ